MATLEIELKFAAPAEIEDRIAALGAIPQGTHDESDHYFNAPDRNFALTNEAFRIRVIDGDCRLTYKGPRQPGPAKTRKEIELRVAADLPTTVSLFESLGYRPVAVVEKRRTVWSLTRDGFDLAICRDEVKRVGQFIEVEIVAEESLKTSAEATLLKVCEELQLRTPEPRSYLRLTLENKFL